MAILFVGIDLAKNVFAIHGVDEHGKAVLVRPSVPRARLHQLVAALPPCTIGMEACSGAHHWARLFAAARPHGAADGAQVRHALSHERQARQDDAADAQAICEAVQRPNMRFVPVKSQDEQARLCVHRVRQGLVEQRTATINRSAASERVRRSSWRRRPPPCAARRLRTWRICPAGPTPPWATR